MISEQWHEITGKDWDRLSNSERELSITPICGKQSGTPNSQRITYAGTSSAIERLNIKSLRTIN